MKFNPPIHLHVPTLVTLAMASTLAVAQPSSKDPAVHDQHAALKDGQILQIVRTLNDAEIKQAKEAVDESKNATVKQVAEMIIADHEEANDKMDEILKGDMSLDGSPLNDSLEKKTEETHEALQDLADAQYDCAYLQKQIAQHQETITLAKTQLEPNADNGEVQAFLNAISPKLQHHLQMAQEGVAKIQGCK